MDGFSGADIKYICDRSATIPFLKSVATGEEGDITHEILDAAIHDAPRSVTGEMLLRFEQWRHRQMCSCHACVAAAENGDAGVAATGIQRVERIDHFLRPFGLHCELHAHAVYVLEKLPDDVLRDIMGEPGVVFYDYDPGPGVVMQVPVRIPGKRGASRSIVLKRTLVQRPVGFVHWLIAHELAHAHLRNQGRWPGDDPEVARRFTRRAVGISRGHHAGRKWTRLADGPPGRR